MQKSKKRRRISSNDNSKSPEVTIRSTKPKNPIAVVSKPYPSHPKPKPEECLAIRDELLQLHGFPEEFAQYRLDRENPRSNSYDSLNDLPNSETVLADDEDGGSVQKLSVLDGLVSTILSQNTTDVNSQRAFASLKSAFPTWDEVLTAEQKLIEDAIRCGGLAPTKASCIKNILNCLKEKNGKLCLEYLHDLSINEIKSELSCFKGIGPKTVACVLMFHLQKDDFPVDTHILQIAKTLGWVPKEADAKKTYLHLNQRIPNELKFDLNCLLFSHGKMCNECSKKAGKLEKKDPAKRHCPLLNYCQNAV